MGMGLAYRWALAGRTLVIGSRIGARAEKFASVLLERVPGADVVGKENAAAAFQNVGAHNLNSDGPIEATF